MWFLTPNSQGLEFLQRGVRCEDVEEADHLQGKKKKKKHGEGIRIQYVSVHAQTTDGSRGHISASPPVG